jgi:hypothetical protein
VVFRRSKPLRVATTRQLSSSIASADGFEPIFHEVNLPLAACRRLTVRPSMSTQYRADSTSCQIADSPTSIGASWTTSNFSVAMMR